MFFRRLQKIQTKTRLTVESEAQSGDASRAPLEPAVVETAKESVGLGAILPAAATDKHALDVSGNVDLNATTVKPFANRNWFSALLSCLTACTYLAVMTQFSQMIINGGVVAWFELIKFNFIQLAGLIFVGPEQFLSQWQSAGAFQGLYLAMLVYWGLCVLYPLAIFGCKPNGTTFSEASSFRQKCVEALTVVAGLLLFLPFPCFRYFRFGGFWSDIGMTSSSIYHKRLSAQSQSLKEAHWLKGIPEYLCINSSWFFSYYVLYYLSIFFIAGPIRMAAADIGYIIWTVAGSTLLVSAIEARLRRGVKVADDRTAEVNAIRPFLIGILGLIMIVILAAGHHHSYYWPRMALSVFVCFGGMGIFCLLAKRNHLIARLKENSLNRGIEGRRD